MVDIIRILIIEIMQNSNIFISTRVIQLPIWTNIKRTAYKMYRQMCKLYIERMIKKKKIHVIVGILTFWTIVEFEIESLEGDKPKHMCTLYVATNSGERGYLLFWFKTRGNGVCFESLDNIYFWEENAWRVKDRERVAVSYIYITIRRILKKQMVIKELGVQCARNKTIVSIRLL